MDADAKIDATIKKAKEHLRKLLQSGNTGRYTVSIEANLSQGSVGDVYLLTHSKEKG